MEVRKEVAWFAQEMEDKLRANDYKGGWSELSIRYLFTRLCEEVRELQRCIYSATIDDVKADEVIKEAADVANFAMMIADKQKNGMCWK